MGGSTGIECVTFARGKATSALVDITSQMENTGQLSFGVAAVADGFMAVGPKNRDGNADTYLISREGALTGTYAKRASADNLLVPSATATGGRLYAIAGVQPLNESGEGAGPAWTFSSTAVETAAQPGDFRQTVRFDANGGTGSMDDQPVTYGDTAALAKNAFTRDGYAFTGWNTAADGTGTAYADAASFTAQQIPPVTLYAQWKAVAPPAPGGGQVSASSAGGETPPGNASGEASSPGGAATPATGDELGTVAAAAALAILVAAAAALVAWRRTHAR